MISLGNVQKKFGGRVALHGLTLEVPQGEIFGLLGHNGAGKSTAIGMMLGQVWPTSGVVKVCGHDVTTHRAKALQKVGAIFEAPAFYDYLSGRRNLEILCQYSGPASPQRIREVVEWVGLTGREDSKVRTYSHGMRARLAIAQALLPQPELVILDEPGSGLDPEGIAETDPRSGGVGGPDGPRGFQGANVFARHARAAGDCPGAFAAAGTGDPG